MSGLGNSIMIFCRLRYVAYNKYDNSWQLYPRRIQDYEMIFVSCGSGVLTLEGKDHPFFENSVLVIPPDSLHSIKSTVTPLSFCCAHFDLYSRVSSSLTASPHLEKVGGSLIKAFVINEDYSQAISLKKLSTSLPPYSKLTAGSLELIDFKQMMKLILSGERESLEKLAVLIPKLTDFLTKKESPQKSASTAELIMEYVEKNYMKSISLAELSSIFHLQQSYISRLFKKSCGISVSEYIRLYRLTIAKGLLRYTDEKLDYIACAAGFYDAPHFCRVFTSSEGVSPTKYRSMDK